MADDGEFNRSNEVGHEDEAVFEDTNCVQGPALVVVGNLTSEIAHSFLNLLGADDHLEALLYWHRFFLREGPELHSQASLDFIFHCDALLGKPLLQE